MKDSNSQMSVQNCYLKCRANPLGFWNILVPETFREGAGNRLTHEVEEVSGRGKLNVHRSSLKPVAERIIAFITEGDALPYLFFFFG
jgi:hypothetical protein